MCTLSTERHEAVSVNFDQPIFRSLTMQKATAASPKSERGYGCRWGAGWTNARDRQGSTRTAPSIEWSIKYIIGAGRAIVATAM